MGEEHGITPEGGIGAPGARSGSKIGGGQSSERGAETEDVGLGERDAPIQKGGGPWAKEAEGVGTGVEADEEGAEDGGARRDGMDWAKGGEGEAEGMVALAGRDVEAEGEEAETTLTSQNRGDDRRATRVFEKERENPRGPG